MLDQNLMCLDAKFQPQKYGLTAHQVHMYVLWLFLHSLPPALPAGKPMGNGYPVAGVVMRRELAEGFNNGME
jgi:hypothetical protein